jgi:phage shock protein PspC (stress-responsive transcriptional regulator)
MNKVQQINLGGVPFTIDDDAYEHLSNYLNSIHRHFEASEGYEEITHDIEARMAELFQENMGNRSIVTLKDVEDAIVIMGTPEDFGAEPIEAIPEKDKEQGYRTGKRLFLNPDDEVVGGVCSGIAAYFGISDPLWIRLAFIIFTLSGGFGIPAYLILWIILPSPKTASDRLAMRGEPINASNIGKIIEEEVENISNKVSEFGNELSGKKKGHEGKSQLGELLRQGISLLGRAIRAAIEVISQIWKPLAIIIVSAFIIATAVAWISTVIGVIFSWPLLEFFSPEWPLLSMLGVFNVLAIVGMLMLSLVLFVTRLIYGTRMSSSWRTGLTVFWILNVVSFFAVASYTFRDFSREGSITSVDQLESSSDTLRLEMGLPYKTDSWFNIDNEFKLIHQGLASRMIDIHIEKAEGSQFEIVTTAIARGQDNERARNLSQSIQYEVQIENNTLTIPPELIVPNGQKWRGQQVDVTLRIPTGKSVMIAESANRHIQTAPKVDRDVMIWRNPNKTWTMTEEGLYCEACSGQPYDSDEMPRQFSDFNKINIQGPVEVNIERGNEYSIEIEGSSEAKKAVKLSQQEHTLNILLAEVKNGQPATIHIELPALTALTSNFAGTIHLEDFDGQKLEINTAGQNELYIDVKTDSLLIVQNGGQKIYLDGRYQFFQADLSNGSLLDARDASIQKAALKARNGVRIEMDQVDEYIQELDESSEINW